MTTSYAAKGTLLKRGNGASTEVFSTINGVRNLDGPGMSREYIDVTHHTSSGGYRERRPSFKDGGQVTFDLLWDPNDVVHEGLLTDYEGDTLRNFKQVFTDVSSTTWQVAAYVSTFEVSAPIDDALMARVALDITGPVDRTP